jgi:hypothetical protein
LRRHIETLSTAQSAVALYSAGFGNHNRTLVLRR